MPSISLLSLVRKPADEGSSPPSVSELRREVRVQTEALTLFTLGSAGRVDDGADVTFKAFEEELLPMLFSLGRTLVTLFLTASEVRHAARLPATMKGAGRSFRRAPAQARSLMTRLGVVRYWRTYMRPAGRARGPGFHPLDVALGLTADRLSIGLISVIARLATKLSFAQARAVAGLFLADVPSTEVFEKSVLGLGRHTEEWFESAPAPEDDGQVLVIQIDSKGAPTATEQELERRRGERRKPGPQSPRHRGRKLRARYGSKPRRKKGDKSKNARMATLVVMYTLTRVGRHLLGPVNRWVYASFAPKRHAFAIARREADKRGFGPRSGRFIQIVTDGDNDLARYVPEFFPNALHTIDVMHVVEKLYEVAGAIHREGSEELHAWASKQKERLYAGRIEDILAELRQALESRPKTGPGNKGRRERLTEVIRYLDKRKHQMNYDELADKDLELGSGAVEGAVKYVIGYRFDHGGMRWIRERAEALLQLRCIELNGDWDGFIQRAHDRVRQQGLEQGRRMRILQAEPGELPAFREPPEHFTGDTNVAPIRKSEAASALAEVG